MWLGAGQTPDGEMHEELGRDYTAMSGMIFGGIPPLDAVLANGRSLSKAFIASGQSSRRWA